jgi:glycosyltransferase involved in cell wall biosynthesis
VRDHGHAASVHHRGKRNVAFVADELLGYAGNGIGTTTTFVSLALARMGYDVEVLFAGAPPTRTVDPEWQRLYDEAGVRVRVVPRRDERVEPPHFARSRDVEAALRAAPPDVVVVQDLGAPAHTAIRLRSLGLAFERTSFVVFCHGTRQWITDVSRKVRVLPGAHAVTVLERASIELADAVVSPSAYLVDWMRGEGWRLPERTSVIAHVSRAAATGEPPPAPPAQPGRVERVAFFGRLEERKGIRPFLRALDALEPELLRDIELEFIGRPTPPWPVERVTSLLADETRRSLRGLAFEIALDQHEALARLRRPGTLAVMPSFEENSPNTIYECLENGIPFLAGDVAGIRELVAAGDHARVLCEPTEEGIAEALRRALTGPDALRPARPAFDDATSLRQWDDVLAVPAAPFPSARPVPSVDVVRRPSALPHGGAEWVLLLDEADEPAPELAETLVRAQQVSGADVVTCGLQLEGGVVHLFAGEPRALGLLSNGYGAAALVRRDLLDGGDLDADWPLLASLSLAGARIVSVPLPLVTRRTAPATLESHPDEALRVLRQFERVLPQQVRLLAELTTRLAAAPPRPASAASGFARRAARRLLAGRTR